MLKDDELFSQKPIGATVAEIKKLINYQTDVDFQALNNKITTRSKEFRQDYDEKKVNSNESEREKEKDQLDVWVESDEGKKTLNSVVSACIELISDDSYNGPPAHDRSHYIKDLYSSLVAMQEDSYRPHEKIAAVISGLMHDFGKTLEVPLMGRHSTGVIATDHANIGFFVTDQLLKSYNNIPSNFGDLLLYAIITHQEGKSEETVSQIVQRADREQLVGVEGVRRMFICDAGLEGRLIDTEVNSIRKNELSLPAKPDDTSLFHHIEFYIRNLYPQIGSQGNNRAESLKVESGIFLSLASPDIIKNQIFNPEITRDTLNEKGEEYIQGGNRFKKVLSSETWKKIKNGPTTEDREEMRLFEDYPLEKLLKEFVARQNTNLSWKTEKDSDPVDVLSNLDGQISNLTDEKRKLLHKALSYALVRINRNEKEMVKLALNISRRTLTDSAENQISNLILSKYK